MEQFDPYHRWLGIPPDEQPANHYRLLGLVLYENDPEVIRDAAERQMGHVRRYGLGKHSELSQKVLNVLGGAKACLLNPAQKNEYDARLKAELAAQAPATPPPLPAQAPVADSPTPTPAVTLVPVAPPKVFSRGKRPLLWGAITGIVIVAIYILVSVKPPVKTEKPVLKLASIERQSVNVGSPLVIRARVTEPEAWAGKVEYRFYDTEPEGATIDERSGEIRWTPETPGVVSMTVLAMTDDGKVDDKTSFTVEIRPEAPKLLPIGDRQVDLGSTLQFIAAVSNASRAGEALVFRLGPGAPRGAQIDPQTGVFTWTPGADPGPGEYPLAVQVVSPAKLSDQASIRIRVHSVNRPPQLQIPETARVVIGSQQRVEIKAQDPDQPADRLTFSVVEGPAWATFDSASGQLTCQPTPDVVTGNYSLRVRVSDGASPPLTDEKTMTVVVEPAALPGMPAGMASGAPPAPAITGLVGPPQGAVAPPVPTVVFERLELAPGKTVNPAEWNLLKVARVRAEELRHKVLARAPGSFARFVRGPGSPIADLCEFTKTIREVYLEGNVISFHDGVSPDAFSGKNASTSSRAGFPLPGAGERRGVAWENVRFRSFAQADNNRWQGGLATWNAQGQPEYYGQYVKGKRQGVCCVFQNGAPRLVADCAADKIQDVYLVAGTRVEKTFADESAARADEQAASLLDQIKRIESDLHRHDAQIVKSIQTEVNLIQGQMTAKARENMRNRAADRENERQNTMSTIKKITTGTP